MSFARSWVFFINLLIAMSTSLGDRRATTPKSVVTITDPTSTAPSQGGARRVLLPCVTVLALALAVTFAGLFGWR
jgi:hypothetical protein